MKADPKTTRDARSWAKRAWYGWLQITCRLLAVGVFRIRTGGREHIPQTGGALIVSNHQSQLDPVIAGVVFNRHLNYLARQTLFRFAPFRWLIQSLDAIPIDREGGGAAGLKETLRRLKRGNMVLIFPEGTRTPDGEIHRFRPGFATVATRAGVPIVPMAILGAYESFPRGAWFPRRAVLQVEVGAPITPVEIVALDERQLAAEAERRVRECFARAKQRRALRMRTPNGA